MRARTRLLRLPFTVLLLAAASLTVTGCFGRYAFIGLGTAIDILPAGYVSVTVGATPYYYHRGTFYRPYRRGYVVVAAPLGALITVPPPGYVMVMVEDDPYHYHRGVFYAPRGGRYAVVRPPIGAFIRSVPDRAVTHTIDGVEYKEYAGAYYRPAIQNGRRGYQVTEPPQRR